MPKGVFMLYGKYGISHVENPLVNAGKKKQACKQKRKREKDMECQTRKEKGRKGTEGGKRKNIKGRENQSRKKNGKEEKGSRKGRNLCKER